MLLNKTIKYLVGCLAGILISLISFIYYQNQRDIKIEKNITAYFRFISKSVERSVIENIPIYSDFVKKNDEKKLRRYLLKKHLKIAKENGVGPLKTHSDIQKSISENKLKDIDLENINYYFYGVSRENRYLTTRAFDGLNKLVDRFQKNLKKRNITHDVKLAISSVIRTVDYQNGLQVKNKNAAAISSHSYGVSFDIFWDDFYVVLPEVIDNDLSSKIRKKIRTKMGFALGDSLRRQFRSILFETLVQLQSEGVLYAILEYKQRCYHVTIL